MVPVISSLDFKIPNSALTFSHGTEMRKGGGKLSACRICVRGLKQGRCYLCWVRLALFSVKPTIQPPPTLAKLEFFHLRKSGLPSPEGKLAKL